MINRWETALVVAGVTVLVGFIVAVLILAFAPCDTECRGAGHGAMIASAWLEIFWVLVAVSHAVLRWRKTNIWFRAILVVNNSVVCLLLLEFLLFE